MTNATAISRIPCVERASPLPPPSPRRGHGSKTNLDTDLLKLIAIAAMLIDHIGGAFFPGRWACSAGSADWPSLSSATA